MLKCDIKRGDHARVEIEANFTDLLYETAEIIKTVHDELYKADPAAANAYRCAIANFMIDSESPLYELVKEAEEK